MRPSSRSRSPQRWIHPAKTFHVGCVVALKGFNVQRNGMRGIAEAQTSSGKWRIKLQKTGQVATFKTENLDFVEPSANPPVVEVRSAARGPDPNHIVLPSLNAVELHVGCEVRLHGLKSAVDLNGQFGVLEEFVEGSGRWRVRLAAGEVKDLKPENLSVKEAGAVRPTDAPASVLLEAAEFEAEFAGKVDFAPKPDDRCGPGGRFIIQEAIGEGQFSTVFRCKDSIVAGMEYAVKFTRANVKTRRALMRERSIMGQLCTRLSTTDPESAKCLASLAFMESFEYQGRLAVVYELAKCNLRTALEKYGKPGLPLLPTVRNFARNIFTALRALRQSGLIHCDVKPENLLLTRDNESVKLGDFGASLTFSEQLGTDEMQPRHYRAPEVILGHEYTSQLDIWSAGVTVYELASGKGLFIGENNNDMLHEMLKVCGEFPTPFSTSGSFALNHFNSNGDFLNARGDMALGSANPRVLPMSKFTPPPTSLAFLLYQLMKTPPAAVTLSRHEGLVRHLIDLLKQCLAPDPKVRATAEVALTHRFFEKGA